MTGLEKLRAAVDKDLKDGGCHDYEKKFEWVINRAKHYEEKTGVPHLEIIDKWEEQRRYWYMNFYQDCNQPELTNGEVKTFETVAELLESIGKQGFRCPNCHKKSESPYECDSGEKVNGKICNWKAYGFLRVMSKGAFVFVKEQMKVENFFMPIAWEKETID